jgi:hypothetical protein
MAMRQDPRLKSFEQIEHPIAGLGGIQQIWQFKNGYGASVIKHKGSYGGNKDLWELAVLQGEELCYTTPITSDVIGHLNDPEVDNLLGKIASL